MDNLNHQQLHHSNNDNNNNSSNNDDDNTIIPSDTSASSSSTSNNTNNRDQFLRHLNKLSHKISKPPPSNSNISSSSSFKKHQLEQPQFNPPPPPLPSQLQQLQQQQLQQQQQQQQPPVYNINKSDFRDVVQKLTGSPAHPPPHAPPQQIHAPKPASSRLQRIRPPPLVQLTTRPPQLLTTAVNPLSPLPPLPTCHAAAESPISAYMRFLHSSVSAADGGAFNRMSQMPPPPPPSSSGDSTGYGWFPSPKSPCQLLSPKMIFSPTGNGPLGFPQFPLSPTVPSVPSPK